MAQPDTRRISFTYAPVASMWVVTLHNLFLYYGPPLHCHSPSYWLRAIFEPNFFLYKYSKIFKPRFSVIFLSCKANARVYDANSGHGPHSPPQVWRLHLSAWQKSLLRLNQSGLRTQTANQPKFIPSIISLCHLATSLWQNQSRPSASVSNR